MGVKVSSLKAQHMYYRVAIVDDPHFGVEVSTWIFIKKENDRYYFLEWNSYKWGKLIPERHTELSVDFGANLDQTTGEFSGLVEAEELLDEIKWALSDELDDE